MKFLLTTASGILGLWLADRFVTGVDFTGDLKIFLLAGFILGLINFFIKPLLKFITLPLRFLTFGLVGLLINAALIWAVDIIFPELIIKGVIPLLWTTLIVWGLGLLIRR